MVNAGESTIYTLYTIQGVFGMAYSYMYHHVEIMLAMGWKSEVVFAPFAMLKRPRSLQ